MVAFAGEFRTPFARTGCRGVGVRNHELQMIRVGPQTARACPTLASTLARYQAKPPMARARYVRVIEA
jgi:hypothetical protein